MGGLFWGIIRIDHDMGANTPRFAEDLCFLAGGFIEYPASFLRSLFSAQPMVRQAARDGFTARSFTVHGYFWLCRKCNNCFVPSIQSTKC